MRCDIRYGMYVETDCGKFYLEEEDGCIVRLIRADIQAKDCCLKETQLLRKAACQLQE